MNFHPEKFRVAGEPVPAPVPPKERLKKGSFRLARTEECLSLGKESGEIGAMLIVTTLLRDKWALEKLEAKKRNRPNPEPFPFGPSDVEPYGVSRPLFRKAMETLARSGWVTWSRKDGQKRRITVLREF